MTVSDRATIRVEETRLLASHALTFNVTQAGIYALELIPQTGFVVAAVRGEGVDDWKLADGKLKVSFNNRVLGARTLDVQLEQPLKTFPERVAIEPLRVVGATKQTALLGRRLGGRHPRQDRRTDGPARSPGEPAARAHG